MNDKLLTAIQQNDLPLVKHLLIEEPSLVEGRHLFAAGRIGDLAMLRYLVEYSRISLNECDREHRNVLHYCAESDCEEAFDYLVTRCGLDPLAGDRNGVTPWELAQLFQKDKILRYMTAHYGRLEDYYKNPIRSGFYPDPSVVRVGADYYMVNSSFVFFPCIPISHSVDLVNWEVIGYAVTNPDWAKLTNLEGGRGFWAPDISYHNGRFYITATYRQNDVPPVYRRQILVSAAQPEGPYSEPVWIDEDGIDPSLFWDGDRCYMLLNRGARILELDPHTMKQTSEAKLLYYGDMKRAPEGPHLYKKDGWYYLLLAEGGTGIAHRATIARARELSGPYEPSPYNPILIQRDPDAALQRCGHGDLVDTPDGHWHLVYLCGRMLDGSYSMLGRETALDPITWTADGWPVVNNGKGPSVLQRKPYPGQFQGRRAGESEYSGRAANPNKGTEAKRMSMELQESDTGLPLEFLTVRTLEEDGIRCTRREVLPPNVTLSASFTLRGSRAKLSSPDCRNLLLRRQTAFCFTAEVTLPLSMELAEGQETGLTGYYDENTYCLFGLCRVDGALRLYARERIGDDERNDLDEKPLSVRNTRNCAYVILRMRTEGLRRSLSYCFTNEIHEGISGIKNNGCFEIFEILNNVYYLCDEGLKKGKRFTGAMVGLYAYEGEGAARPFYSEMEDFRYEDEA